MRHNQSTDSIRAVLTSLDEVLQHMDYVNALYWLFGISSEEAPSQTGAFHDLLALRDSYVSLIEEARSGQRVVLTNADELLANYRNAAQIALETKTMWKARLRVIAADTEVIRMARAVRDGEPIVLRKAELARSFSLADVIPTWDQMPAYTIFVLGGGIRVSSPEFDAFEAMAWFHDETVISGDAVRAERAKAETEEFDEDQYQEVLGRHVLMARQTVLCAFLVIESFINSEASLFLGAKPGSVSDADRLFLMEKRREPHGQVQQRLVSIEDKLTQWVKIMSPRSETLEKGRRPFQDFAELKRFRDAMVHFGESKAKHYYMITGDTAIRAVSVTLDMIMATRRCLSPEPESAVPPWWFRHRASDRRFGRAPRPHPLSPPA